MTASSVPAAQPLDTFAGRGLWLPDLIRTEVRRCFIEAGLIAGDPDADEDADADLPHLVWPDDFSPDSPEFEVLRPAVIPMKPEHNGK